MQVRSEMHIVEKEDVDIGSLDRSCVGQHAAARRKLQACKDCLKDWVQGTGSVAPASAPSNTHAHFAFLVLALTYMLGITDTCSNR